MKKVNIVLLIIAISLGVLLVVAKIKLSNADIIGTYRYIDSTGRSYTLSIVDDKKLTFTGNWYFRLGTYDYYRKGNTITYTYMSVRDTMTDDFSVVHEEKPIEEEIQIVSKGLIMGNTFLEKIN